jgi:hypothetical protein
LFFISAIHFFSFVFTLYAVTELLLSRREWVSKYAGDPELFFKKYAAAHKHMSELGSKFDPAQGIFM